MRYLFLLASLALVGGMELAEAAKEGGKITLNGQEIDLDLPAEQHLRNKGGSDGAGLCVFTSIDHSARWQRCEALIGFRDWMTRYPGGGYPEKVSKKITQICKERKLPEPSYLQIFGQVDEDLKILEAACKSGRMPGITYSFATLPGRYRGRISHMTTLVSADSTGDGAWVVLDNNFPGVDKYEHLTTKEFIRTYTGGGRAGWAVIICDPGGPPPPPFTK